MAALIKTGSRIHCSLLDLGSATEHAYGGAGFMLEGPEVKVSAVRSSAWHVTSGLLLETRTRDDLEETLSRLSQHTKGISATLSIESLPPQHVGLGTKTSLLLACLLAVKEELKIPLDMEALQLISGRGGASGVGIHGFFTGGFLVDAGHPIGGINTLVPSSNRHPSKPPLLSVQFRIPSSWRFHLVLPKGRLWEGSAEAQFFTNNTPIPKEEVYEAIAVTYHGLVPAVYSGDIRQLGRALARLQTIGFKARELSAQSSEVQLTYQALSRIPSAATGLSSMGPLLYIILDENDEPGAKTVTDISKETDSTYLGAFPGLSHGYTSLS